MNEKSDSKWVSMSDKALIKQIGAFVKHHRLEQNKTQKEVSEEAGISRSTLSLLERGESVSLITLIQVLRILDKLQIINSFRVEETISPITLAKLEKDKRQRAGKHNLQALEKSEW